MAWRAMMALVIGSILLAGCVQAPFQQSPDVRQAGPISAPLPDGEAVWVVGIDANGQIVDSLPASGTSALLDREGEVFLRGVAFAPALRFGRTTFAHVAVRLSAEGGEVYVNAFYVELLDAPGIRGRTGEERRIVQLDRVDEGPKLLRDVRPDVRSGGGEIQVQFLIDETGRVRMPMVLGSHNAEADAAVLRAVSEWIFAPPRRRGAPIVVLVRQTLRL